MISISICIIRWELLFLPVKIWYYVPYSSGDISKVLWKKKFPGCLFPQNSWMIGPGMNIKGSNWRYAFAIGKLHQAFKIRPWGSTDLTHSISLLQTTGWCKKPGTLQNMMTSSNGNISALLALCVGNSPGHQWIPLTKASDAELRCFSLICVWINGLVNDCEAGDLRCHRAHYDITVMHTACM